MWLLLEDQVLFCAQFVGMEMAIDIDLVRFDGLFEACERLYGKKLYDSTKLYIACAQAEEKFLDERLEQYSRKQLIPWGKREKGSADLIKAVGKGI